MAHVSVEADSIMPLPTFLDSYCISKDVGLQAIASEDLWRTQTHKNHSPSVDEILGKADVGWGPCDGNLTL